MNNNGRHRAAVGRFLHAAAVGEKELFLLFGYNYLGQS
jgi:hypothetical protein